MTVVAKLVRDPHWATILLIVGLALYYGALIGLGEINRYDEFKTLERTLSFEIHNTWWTVHSSGNPDFKKPPLQYWMGAWAVHAGVGEVIAVRLPSYLFAIGGLVIASLMARELSPEHKWAQFLAPLLLASSDEYWDHALSAMLDSGSTLLACSALYLAMKAVKDPRWWIPCGLVIGLGALQKAPVGAGFVVLYVLFCLASPPRNGAGWPGLRDGRILLATLIALALIAFWPGLQAVLHGGRAISVGVEGEMVDRFAVASVLPSRSVEDIWKLFFGNEGVLRLPCVIALALLPSLLGRREVYALPAIVLVFALMMIFAQGNVFPRYTLNVLPILVVALAIAVCHLNTRRRRAALWLGLLVVLASKGPVKSPWDIQFLALNRPSDEGLVLPIVGAQVEAGEHVFVCNWEKSHRLSPGAVSLMLAKGAPHSLPRRVPSKTLLKSWVAEAPLRGVCSAQALMEMAPMLSGLVQVETLPGDGKAFVHWTATGLSP